VNPSSGRHRGNENLHVSPANACTSKGASVPIDERSRIGCRWTWQMRKGSEITRERLGQARAQEQLADDDVTGADPLLG
jgi:hypothetical protein